MKNFEKCPNCGKSLKGFFNTSVLIEESKRDFINKFTNINKEGFCTSCYEPLYYAIVNNQKKQKNDIEQRLKQIINFLQIMSCPAPIKWEYEVIGMVTAQQTAGTGFYTELSRSFNDFFGSGSNATNKKIKTATDACQTDLRIQCSKLGGNAIISTDIDFNEIGSGSTNMLMVCMAGTAIRVTNMENFSEKMRDYLTEISDLTYNLDAIINDIPKSENQYSVLP